MNQFETVVQEHLDMTAEQVDPRGEQRVLGRVTRDVASRRRRSAAVAMVAGIAATVAVISGISLGTSGDSAPTADDAPDDVAGHAPLGGGVDNLDLVEKLGNRCPGAVEAGSPAELQRLTKATVAAPTVGKLSAAWACGENGVLWYDNGVQISFETGWSKVDVPTKWELRVKEDGGRVENIGGLPAYIYDAEDEGTRNVVAIVEGDTLISLLSERDVPVETMVGMAKSIDLKQ